MTHRDQSYLRISLISLNLLKDIITYFFNNFIYVSYNIFIVQHIHAWEILLFVPERYYIIILFER